MMKKIFKERSNGLFLLILAGAVLGGLMFNSHLAESKKGQDLAQANDYQNEGRILGEANNSTEEIASDSEEIGQDTEITEENSDQKEAPEKEEKKEEDKNTTEDDYYKNLKERLKKYCGKSYNVKKCKDYLLEAKDIRKKGERFKDLYKKYHFVPKRVEKKDDNSSSDTNSGSSEVKEEATLAINYAGSKSDDKYTVVIESGMTVMDMMERAKSGGLSYDESTEWAGYIMEINGVREDHLKSMYWMFYSNGAMSDKGASEKEVGAGDKIEWEYTKF